MLEIALTPSKYLSDSQRYKRSQLFNGKLTAPKLELMHDRFNSNDSLALEIFCDEIMIGYVQKYNSEYNIDDYCFSDSELLSSIKILLINNKLMIDRESDKHPSNYKDEDEDEEEFTISDYIDISTGRMSDLWYEKPGDKTPW